MIRFQDYRRRMERHAAAHFTSQGLPVRQRAPYILRDWKDWPRNLIQPQLAELVWAERERRQAQGQGFPLHKYVHHGLSSQAMLFNLVLPLLAADDIDALGPAFAAARIPWPGPGATAKLEVEDRAIFAETQGQPTSFDLRIDGPGAAPIFVEAKLVEPAFGGCSLLAGGDCEGWNPALDPARCPLQRMGRRYWERLDELGFMVGELASSPVCLLGSYYQFFREAAFALASGGCFVLLVHGDNPAFQRDEAGDTRGLWPFLCRFVPPERRHRLQRITLQGALAAVEASGRHDSWTGIFRQRYGLDRGAKASPDPADVDAVLASLPTDAAAVIRQLWQREVRGGRARGDRRGQAGQRRISQLLRGLGIVRGDDRYKAIIEHGRRLYGE